MSKGKSSRIDAKCVNWRGEVYTITVGESNEIISMLESQDQSSVGTCKACVHM
jgi:hypothetical protein